MERQDTHSLPTFLRSFEDLTAHFDEHFGALGSNDRGDTFLALAEQLIPLADESSAFPPPIPSPKKTHDGGVDLLTVQTSDGRALFIQSKYKIRSKDELDLIISKFCDYEQSRMPATPPTPSMFEETDRGSSEGPSPTFLVITSSKLQGLRVKYETSTLASKDYYSTLRAQKRLLFIDGPRILEVFQQLYRKAHLLPANIALRSLAPWGASNDVHLGVVPGHTLAELYMEHGDALFFENIREFLGTTSGRKVTTRSTVNQEIIRTIKDEPGKMLSRNNGVTFRAQDVQLGADGTLHMQNAAIVNGCQTTMCLVHSMPVTQECSVQVKVVCTEDAWDIAKAANYQNLITRVELDLARYLRPQLVRKVATNLGFALQTQATSTAAGVLNAIYQNRIDYEDLKLLYLGLFSRKPNNLFEGNYAELRADILELLYESPGAEEAVFTVLMLLLKESRQALEKCEAIYSGQEYARFFKRFYQDTKPTYRAYFAIAAMSALQRDDVSTRPSNAEVEVARLKKFLAKAREILENAPERYHDAFALTVQAVADTLLDVPEDRPETEIAQGMFQKVSKGAFSALHKRILMRLDAADHASSSSSEPDR